MEEIKREPIKDLSKKPQRFSAKLIELTRWEFIDEVNSQLDKGTSPYTVHKWINKKGFKISCQGVYDYDELRRRSVAEGVTMERMLGVVRNPVNTNFRVRRTLKDKLRSELDALDFIIQKGYDDLKNSDEPIRPGTMMAAIKLKNELTDGTHGFLTNFGMEHLRGIEDNKFALIVKHLLSYIPKSKQNEALSKMAEIEENYYYHTDYYEEYLRAVGTLSEEQIQIKLEKWKVEVLTETKEHMETVESWYNK